MKIFPVDLNHPLVRDKKLQAIFRFVKWQIKSRIFQREFVHGWVSGAKFYVRNGETGLTQNIYVGLHEFNDMCFLLHLLRKNDTFIDVGANSGSYSILAGSIIGARTLALEPIPSTYIRLVANFELNGIESPSQAINVGLGAVSGSAYMTSQFDTTNQIILDDNSSHSIKVEIKTLDEVASHKNPTLIKIDVEGWESEVLRGGFETLRNPSLLAIILELNDSGKRYGYLDSEILRGLEELGFQPISYDPFGRALKQLTGKNPLGGNTIFIRNELEIVERIENSPERDILGSWI